MKHAICVISTKPINGLEPLGIMASAGTVTTNLHLIHLRYHLFKDLSISWTFSVAEDICILTYCYFPLASLKVALAYIHANTQSITVRKSSSLWCYSHMFYVFSLIASGQHNSCQLWDIASSRFHLCILRGPISHKTPDRKISENIRGTRLLSNSSEI